jgi:hypothetical protein
MKVRGRPARSVGVKSRVISFSMTPKEQKEFIQEVERYGLGVSAFIRFLFLFWQDKAAGVLPRENLKKEVRIK